MKKFTTLLLGCSCFLVTCLYGQAPNLFKELPKSNLNFASMSSAQISDTANPAKLLLETELQVFEDKKNDLLNKINTSKKATTNLIDQDIKTNEDRERMKSETARIDELLLEMTGILKSIDSLNLLLGEVKVQSRIFNFVALDYASSQAFNKLMYSDEDRNGLRAATSSGLNVGNGAGSIYSDIFSGPISYVYIRFGTILANRNRMIRSKLRKNPLSKDCLCTVATPP
jgi:hypothetical protein